MAKLQSKMRVSFLSVFIFALVFLVDSASSTSRGASIDSVHQGTGKLSEGIVGKDSIVADIENMVRSFIEKISEGKSYRLQFPCIGVVDCSQADINKGVDMIVAHRRDLEYFASSPEYRHLAHRMGSEHLGKMLSKNIVSIDFVDKKGTTEAVDESLPPYSYVMKNPSDEPSEEPTKKHMPLWFWIVIGIIGTGTLFPIAMFFIRKYSPKKIEKESEGDLELGSSISSSTNSISEDYINPLVIL